MFNFGNLSTGPPNMIDFPGDLVCSTFLFFTICYGIYGGITSQTVQELSLPINPKEVKILTWDQVDNKRPSTIPYLL